MSPYTRTLRPSSPRMASSVSASHMQRVSRRLSGSQRANAFCPCIVIVSRRPSSAPEAHPETSITSPTCAAMRLPDDARFTRSFPTAPVMTIAVTSPATYLHRCVWGSASERLSVPTQKNAHKKSLKIIQFETFRVNSFRFLLHLDLLCVHFDAKRDTFLRSAGATNQAIGSRLSCHGPQHVTRRCVNIQSKARTPPAIDAVESSALVDLPPSAPLN